MFDRRTETWDDLKERKEALDAHFRSGAIGEPTYIVSLGILGFTEREAKDELNYLKRNR